MQKHPIDVVQEISERKERENKLRDIGFQYGIAAAMDYKATEKIMSRFHRLPGLRSSNLGLEIHTGRINKLDASDFLGDQELHRSNFTNLHATMEHKLKM